MNRQLYSERILEHYRDPSNFGTVESPDMESEAANPNCGDDLRFTARLEDGRFGELKFDGDGCALSIASASLLTEKLEGEEVGSIQGLEEGEVFEMLGIQKDDIAPLRVKCVLLAKKGIEEMVGER